MSTALCLLRDQGVNGHNAAMRAHKQRCSHVINEPDMRLSRLCPCAIRSTRARAVRVCACAFLCVCLCECFSACLGGIVRLCLRELPRDPAATGRDAAMNARIGSFPNARNKWPCGSGPCDIRGARALACALSILRGTGAPALSAGPMHGGRRIPQP